MLSATSNRPFGSSTLKTTVFLERRFRAHLASRDRLLYDSAYAPPAKKPSAFVHLYASLRGSLAIDGKPPTVGPQAFMLAETEFDRVLPTSAKFRSWGAPAVIVEIRVPAADVRRPIGLMNGALDLPPDVWDAYTALETARSEEALHHLIVRLGEAGVLSRDLTSSIVAAEPERFLRLWA